MKTTILGDRLWDGQGASVDSMFAYADGILNEKRGTFVSYISSVGYVSRYTTDKKEEAVNLSDPTEYTKKSSGKSYKTHFKVGEEFTIITDSGSMVIEDKVKVIDHFGSRLLWLESTQS